MNRHQENHASSLSFHKRGHHELSSSHPPPHKNRFFLQKKLFLFYFFTSLVLVACSAEKEESEETDAKPVKKTEEAKQPSVSECRLQVKDLDVGQTKTFDYFCTIAESARNTVAKISYEEKDLIKFSIAQISIPNQASVKGSLTAKGLKAGTVKGSIKIASHIEDFQFTVTSPFIPKAKDFTFTKITPMITLKTKQAARKFSFNYSRLAAHQNKLYRFETAKYFVTADGKNWTEKDKIHSHFSGKSNYISYKNKLWAFGDSKIFNSNDGNSWTEATPFPWSNNQFYHTTGSIVIFQGRMNLLFGMYSDFINSSDDGKTWKKEYEFTKEMNKNFGQILLFDGVVHDNKIWIIGGQYGKDQPSKSVFSYDGSNFQQEADIPETRFHAGTASFAKGLVVVGGRHDKDTPRTSLIYSPYGSHWHTIINDTADKIGDAGGNDGIKAVLDMQKWTPKTGSHQNKEALWVINKDGLVYRIAYKEK